MTQICSKPESQERKKDVSQLQNSMPSQFCFLQVSAQQVRQSNPNLSMFKFPVLECRWRNLLDSLIPTGSRLGREIDEVNSLIWPHGAIRVDLE